MQTIQTITELKTAIYELPTDASIALVFLEGKLDNHAIIAIRNADKLCDFVIVIWLNKNSQQFDNKEQSFLEQAGCKLFFSPPNSEQNSKNLAQIIAKGKDITFLGICILTVMPLMVSCSAANQSMASKLKALEQIFAGSFTLVIKEIPVDLLSMRQQKLRSCLELATKAAKTSKGDVTTIIATVKAAIIKANIGEIEKIEILDQKTLLPLNSKILSAFYINLRLSDGLTDVVLISLE